MIHAWISAVFCALVALLGLPAWLCLAPAVWYMGREFTQAEYRYIEAHWDGKRANMPWYAPFTPRAWTAKGLRDWLCPAAFCLVFVGFEWWKRGGF